MVYGESAQCCVVAWIGGKFGEGMDACLCMTETLCSPPETITISLIGYIQYKIKKLN